MKLFRISLLLFCASLFSSCVGEWMERECQGDFTLYFEYKRVGNSNPTQTFLDNVQTVELFFFDGGGNLVYNRTILRDQMMNNRGNGTRSTPRPGLDLPIGTGERELAPGNSYRVVAWGNADRFRQAFHTTQVVNAHIATAPDGGTPLHFGPGSLRGTDGPPMWITIPESPDDYYAVVEFTRSHIEVQVFVVNAAATPLVGLDGVARDINFNNQPNSERIAFSRLADGNRNTPLGALPHSVPANFVSFYTPLFDENTNKTLEISIGGIELENGVIQMADVLAGRNPITGEQNSAAAIDLLDTNNPVMQVPIVLALKGSTVVDMWVPGWTTIAAFPDGLLPTH